MAQHVGRRFVLKSAAAAAAFPGLALAGTGVPQAKPATSETLAATLWKSLRPEQKKVVAFPFDHPLRSKVDNNWEISEPIADVFLDVFGGDNLGALFLIDLVEVAQDVGPIEDRAVACRRIA